MVFQILHAGAEGIPALTTDLFEFGADHITALTANASSLITSFWPIVLIVVGLALAMWIVGKLISVFRSRVR